MDQRPARSRSDPATPGVERADGRPALIRGRELLAVADLLAAQHDEAFQRSAISRSYYAAHLKARLLCEDHLGFVRTARGAEHQDVPRLVGTIDFDLRTHLSILRRLRNAADDDTDLSNETMRRSARDARSYADVLLIGLDRIRASLESESGALPVDRLQEP